MAETLPQPTSFATARCPNCLRQRPAYDRLGENNEIQQACLVCDAPMIITDYCTLDELSGLGFGLVEEAQKGGGCGGSGGGCSSGGCSHKSKLN